MVSGSGSKGCFLRTLETGGHQMGESELDANTYFLRSAALGDAMSFDDEDLSN